MEVSGSELKSSPHIWLHTTTTEVTLMASEASSVPRDHTAAASQPAKGPGPRCCCPWMSRPWCGGGPCASFQKLRGCPWCLMETWTYSPLSKTNRFCLKGGWWVCLGGFCGGSLAEKNPTLPPSSSAAATNPPEAEKLEGLSLPDSHAFTSVDLKRAQRRNIKHAKISKVMPQSSNTRSVWKPLLWPRVGANLSK